MDTFLSILRDLKKDISLGCFTFTKNNVLLRKMSNAAYCPSDYQEKVVADAAGNALSR